MADVEEESSTKCDILFDNSLPEVSIEPETTPKEVEPAIENAQVDENAGEEEEDDEVDDVYEVEKIVGMTKTDGKTLYKVRWVNYGPEWDTWEPYENLSSCVDMIEAYEKKHEEIKRKRDQREQKKKEEMIASDVFSDETSETDKAEPKRPKVEPQAQVSKSKAPRSKASYTIVDSDDENFNTLKDNFWNDLEKGKLNVFETGDMYSKVKEQGRAARPASFKKMFSDKIQRQDSSDKESGEKKKKVRRRSSETKQKRIKIKIERQRSQTKSMEIISDSESSTSKTSSVIKTEPKVLVQVSDTDTGTDTYSISDIKKPESDSDENDDIPIINRLKATVIPSTKKHDTAKTDIKKTKERKKKKKSTEIIKPVKVESTDIESPTVESEALGNQGMLCVKTKAQKKEVYKPAEKTKKKSKPGPLSFKMGKKAVKEMTDDKMDMDSKIVAKSETVSEIKMEEETEVIDKDIKRMDVKLETGDASESDATDVSVKIRDSNATDENDMCLYDSASDTSGSIYSAKLKPSAIKQPTPPEKVQTKPKMVKKSKSKNEKVKKGPEVKVNVTNYKAIFSNQEKSSDEQGHIGDTSPNDNPFNDVDLRHLIPRGQPSNQPDTPTVIETDQTLDAKPVMTHPKQNIAHVSPQVQQPQQSFAAALHQQYEAIMKGTSKLIDDGDLDFGKLITVDADTWDQEASLMSKITPVEITQQEFKMAVKKGDYDSIRKALHSKKTYDLNHPDSTGMTLVMIAAQQGFDDILELILLHGAEINARQKNGSTALIHAAEQGHLCTVAILIEMGANMNFQQSSGETALIKAVKKNHKAVVRVLLNEGANFALTTHVGEHTALKFAQMMHQASIQNLIEVHKQKLILTFEEAVNVTLNNTAKIMHELFPIQCFSLSDGTQCTVRFKHELQPTVPGIGMLLFIAHARINAKEVKCRFYGPCAVSSVVLNDVKQPPLTEESNFVTSCCPLHNGMNELIINTVGAPTSKAKLVVCAYKAQLSVPPE